MTTTLKLDETHIIVPPDQWEATTGLRFIDDVLHLRYVPHPNLGQTGEHWQPVEVWNSLPKIGPGIEADPVCMTKQPAPVGTPEPQDGAKYGNAGGKGVAVPPGQEQGSAAGTPPPDNVEVK